MNSRKSNRSQQYTGNLVDLESNLALHISNTGKEQIKERMKAGLSAYYLKNDRLVEMRPDRTEIEGKHIASKWVKLEKKNRIIILK